MAWAVWCVAGIVAMVGLSARAAEPIPAEAVPTPPERPAGLLPTPLAEPPPPPPARPADLTPAAPQKAAEEAAPASAMPVPPPAPPERPADLSGEAALALKVAPPDDEACRVRLKRLGVTFEPLPPIAEGQCTAPLPLKVIALADGVALRPAATLTCRVAESLARWTTEVQVSAQRSFGHPLTGLEIGGSYVCRGQNHDLDAKLSEHAFADAIDIMAFSVEGRAPIPVGPTPQDQPAGAFLQTGRATACTFFRTVLGPGSNAAHANHFHFDERERTAGHRLCE